MKKLISLVLGFIALAFTAMSQTSPATFPGGEAAMNSFIAKNMIYPASAIEMNAEGTVVVSVTVKSDGSLADPKVVRKVNPDLEKEALRVISKMPKWTPAQKDGAPVDFNTRIPFKFRIK